ncbi:MAG TPA: hypothetical protein VN906_10015 [Candidatus Sulfotelmatobacter sp.]|nr:hypothetical protein [Candidatus Sulfotelmatobacter sp.]
MNLIDLEELGQRVRELPIDRPDAKSVTARVLATRRASPPRRSWSPAPRLRALAAVAAVLVLTWAVFYFSPATGAALADTPVGPFSSFVLQEAGLGNGTAVTSQDASASQAGVSVRLLGVSANPIQTVILLKVSPVDATPVYATLTDQFGTSYEFRGGYGDLRTGDLAEIFAPPSGFASTLGMRFTFTLSGVDAHGSVIPATWTIRGTVLPHGGLTFAAPQPATLGQVTVTFSGGREADGIMQITAHVHGVTTDQLGLSQKQTAGTTPPLTVEVIDGKGNALEVPYELVGESGGFAINVLAYGASGHGTYTVRITIQGFGSVERSVSY